MRTCITATIKTVLCAALIQYGIGLAHGRDITLAWNPNPQAHVAGYKLYYGHSPRAYGEPVNTGKQTSYTIRNLAEKTCCFAVTSYDAQGNESDYSGEVCILPDGQVVSSQTLAFTGNSKDNSWRSGTIITNFDSKEVLLTLTAYSQDGLVLKDDDALNPQIVKLNPGQQLQFVDMQLFHNGTPPASFSGWIQADTAPAISGFNTVFDSSFSMFDGVLVSGTAAKSLLLPEIEEAGFTQIRIANPGKNPSRLTIALIDENGIVQKTAVREVNSHGMLSETLPLLFPDTDYKNTWQVQISSTKDVAATAILGRPEATMRVINGISTDSGKAVLYSPQYVHSSDWSSSISIVNLGVGSGTVTMQLRGDNGEAVSTALTANLPAKGKIRLDDILKPNDPGQSIQGSIEIISNGPRIAGTVTFSDAAKNHYAATLPLISSPSRSFLFPFVKHDEEHYTGIAISNPNEDPVRITLEIFAEDGQSLGIAQHTIAGKGRSSRLISEYLPEFAVRRAVSMKVSGDKPIVGIALLGRWNSASLVPLVAEQKE